jgi:hypothetical protein
LLLKLFEYVLAALIKHKGGVVPSKASKWLSNSPVVPDKLLVKVAKA